MLTVSNIQKSFHNNRQKIHVLKDISFTLGETQTLSIVGPSGSGKSTLLALLASFDSPDSGEIQFQGKNLSSMSTADLISYRSKDIGLIFQQFHLIPHFTALENVSLVLDLIDKENAELIAKNALELVGLGERLFHFPRQLSGGEKQRVAIARAFAKTPKLLFADEPSGNLDQDTGKQIMDLLFKMCQDHKMAMVLITHDSSLSQKCQFKYKLNHGKLVNEN
jgi:putative ABC transport system ATP-binding protein